MKRDSKLSLALHALGHMAARPDHPLRSEDMALAQATNPVVVRRVLGLLRQAGLLHSAKGHDGGWRLARPASAITVADVYRAIGEPVFARPAPGPDNPPHCAIERALHTTMQNALAEAETLLTTRLDRVTIAMIAGELACVPGMPQPG
jgi:Rrf2 family protein